VRKIILRTLSVAAISFLANHSIHADAKDKNPSANDDSDTSDLTSAWNQNASERLETAVLIGPEHLPQPDSFIENYNQQGSSKIAYMANRFDYNPLTNLALVLNAVRSAVEAGDVPSFSIRGDTSWEALVSILKLFENDHHAFKSLETGIGEHSDGPNLVWDPIKQGAMEIIRATQGQNGLKITAGPIQTPKELRIPNDELVSFEQDRVQHVSIYGPSPTNKKPWITTAHMSLLLPINETAHPNGNVAGVLSSTVRKSGETPIKRAKTIAGMWRYEPHR